LLDDDEAVAVALGLRTAANGAIAGIEESSVRALLKLEQVLPTRLRQRVAALHAYIVPLKSRRPGVDADLLSLIAGACRDHDSIRFPYQNRTGAPSVRTVEPYRVVHTGYRWYLAAWDTGRKDWRTFRVDRIEGIPKTTARFKPRKAPGDFAVFVAKSLAQVQYPFRARVTLHAPAPSLAERIPPSAGVLEAINQDSCVLHTGSQSLEGLTIHLLLLGVQFQVHEPPELIAYIRTLTGRLQTATSG
jgi:predicted DNA-binding transcriptional regulator YafY